ncbi:hypothetical protein SCAR479_12717 [Seiridium cardinale]|uniref:Uncharacterized protein n=1 Tax=Seiridium cardinale TaxID=138064 RepID=A0ABR2XA25_9PEZI
MALPQSQCCRVIHRQLRSPCDGSLIPESALASAFEQLCSVSRGTSRRNGSNVPGPLESRRRMGKRHMGELNFGHMNAPAPFWEIANAVDLTQWRWAPPTSFENRHSQREADSQPFLASIQSWLARASNSPSTPLGTTAQEDIQETCIPQVVAMEAVAQASPTGSMRSVNRAVTTPLRRLPSEHMSRIMEEADELMRQGLSTIFSRNIANGSSSQNLALDSFCDRLKTAIARGTTSRDVLRIFLNRITKETYGATDASGYGLSKKHYGSQLLRVYTAVLDGLCADSQGRHEHFDHYHSVYATLLDKTAQLEINSLRLFQRIMANVPAESIWRCKNEIASNIHASLAALSRPVAFSHRVVDGKERANIIRQVNKMAGSLRNLSSETPFQRNILERITQRLAAQQEMGSEGEEQCSSELLRFSWLHMLARLPQVETGYLASACNALDSSPSIEPLAQRQICELFLARINSRYSVKDVAGLYNLLKVSSESYCYAAISYRLWTTGQQRYVKMLANLLRRLGRQQDVRHVVYGLRNKVHNESKPLANIAIGLGHPQLALWVYIRYHQSRWKSRKFWNTAFAQETLDKLLEFREMKSEKLLDALRIFPRSDWSRRHTRLESMAPAQGNPDPHARRKPRILPQRRVRQTEKIASALARARYLSERTALARISCCIKFLQSHNASIPPQVLRALFDIVTRDLAAGKPGRTARLKWFLSLLLKETDTKNVLEVGRALLKWRGLLYPAHPETAA